MQRLEILKAVTPIASDRAAVFAALRQFPVDSVGDFLLDVPNDGALRAILPVMASGEVQRNWTGSEGSQLLAQSCAIARVIETGYMRYVGRTLQDTKILDFGCGWGRLIRLMYKFTAPDNIYGCDPWQRSLDICKGDNVSAHLALSDYLPTTLPFSGVDFGLIYAFSVFTHLSERAASTAMNALRGAIGRDGLLVITVRPPSYWDYHDQRQNQVDREAMKTAHRTTGFAFTPHQRDKVDGDITYGDSSISVAYIEKNWPTWQIIGTDALLQDPYQHFVFLKPR